MNNEKAAEHWNDCVNHIGDVMLLNPENRRRALEKKIPSSILQLQIRNRPEASSLARRQLDRVATC
jgi:hypothetical protein